MSILRKLGEFSDTLRVPIESYWISLPLQIAIDTTVFPYPPRPSAKLTRAGERWSLSVLTLNYDIQSCQVVVLPGSGNPEEKKYSKVREQSQEMRSCYPSQVIVWSLTARRWRSLLRITRSNPPQRATGRTPAEGRTAAAVISSHFVCSFLDYRIGTRDFFKRKSKVLKTNGGVGRSWSQSDVILCTWTALQRVQHKLRGGGEEGEAAEREKERESGRGREEGLGAGRTDPSRSRAPTS